MTRNEAITAAVQEVIDQDRADGIENTTATDQKAKLLRVERDGDTHTVIFNCQFNGTDTYVVDARGIAQRLF